MSDRRPPMWMSCEHGMLHEHFWNHPPGEGKMCSGGRWADPADLIAALGFPSGEDVETAAKGVAAGDPADLRCWDEMCEFARNELRLLARAALKAVADAHRTEEKT